MKNLKHYTYEEAVAKIEADEKLKAVFEKLRPEYEDTENRMDYGLKHCDFWEDWDTDTDSEFAPICISWQNDKYFITVDTLEQAVCIVKDIEEAKGNIK